MDEEAVIDEEPEIQEPEGPDRHKLVAMCLAFSA